MAPRGLARALAVIPLVALAILLPTGRAPALSGGGISFAAPLATTFGFSVGDLTAADLDGDGKTDLAIIGGGNLNILYGRGDGTFDPPVGYPLDDGSGQSSIQVLATDLNN